MRFTKRFISLPLLLVLFLALVAHAQTTTTAPTQPATQSARPIPEISRVLIISVDGLRPDLALRANTPALRNLMDNGTYTFWAKTTAMSITLPSHTSMLTGVNPRKHGIEWNSDLPLSEPVYPNFPTIFELAHRAGYTTAMAAGKSKFDTLAKPHTIDWLYVPERSTSSDISVLAQALKILRQHQPEVLFVHFPEVDNVGHSKGWATDEQITAIENADACIAKILAVEKELKLLDSTLVIVSADHGGAGLSHGPEDPRSRHIPWIAMGPTVRKNYDLTRIDALTVNTEDTFATAAYVLGLNLNPRLDGKPVLQIFTGSPNAELLQTR